MRVQITRISRREGSSSTPTVVVVAGVAYPLLDGFAEKTKTRRREKKNGVHGKSYIKPYSTVLGRYSSPTVDRVRPALYMCGRSRQCERVPCYTCRSAAVLFGPVTPHRRRTLRAFVVGVSAHRAYGKLCGACRNKRHLRETR